MAVQWLSQASHMNYLSISRLFEEEACCAATTHQRRDTVSIHGAITLYCGPSVFSMGPMLS